jgi:hypothetical protein
MLRRRYLLLILAGALLLALGRAGLRAVRLRSARLRVPIVYLHDAEDGADVVLRQGKSVRSLYEAADSLDAFDVPDELGLLPSPDETALLVWQNVTSLDDPETVTALWSVVSVATGRKSTILEENEPSPPLPRWDGPGRIIVAGEEADHVATVDHGAAQPALLRRRSGPAQSARDQQTPRLAAYADALLLHGVTGRQVKRAAAKAGVDTRDYEGHEEDVWRWMIRACGVPVSDEVDDPSLSPLQAAVSPGARFAAVTDVYGTRVPVIEWGYRTTGRFYGYGARLTVVDLGTGRAAWTARVAPRANPEYAHRSPYLETLPGPLPLLEPSIGDVRWSPDGKHLSFTVDYWTDSEVRVVDTRTWTVVLRVPHARDAFVLRPQPSPPHTVDRASGVNASTGSLRSNEATSTIAPYQDR